MSSPEESEKKSSDAAGNRTPMTLNVNSEEFNCVAPITGIK
jgi:hypothetical protein